VHGADNAVAVSDISCHNVDFVISVTQLDEMYKESYGLVTRLTELLSQIPEVPEQ
jgi:hypothetical protein